MAPETSIPVVPIASSTRPSIPSFFANTNPSPTLHYQGAEALLYRTFFLTLPSSSTSLSTDTPPLPAALKFRPKKPYRHPTLDAKLTRHRILAEARILAKLQRSGIHVPALYALDWEDGWMLMEWIEGRTVRSILDDNLQSWLANTHAHTGGMQPEKDDLWRLMGKIGREAGHMHDIGVVHGDLTTSNILLKLPPQTDVHGDENAKDEAADNQMLAGEPVLIDFGLSEQSTATEDRAVDLYVLERAFGSTHPGTEKLFGEVLRAYGESYKGAKATLKRLEEVRMRGRKKIMIG